MANTVNLTAPNDFQTQQQAIERQRRLAEALQQQSMEQMQGQTVPGGFYVPPSPVQGLARLAQALVSKHQQDSADQKQSDLSDRQRNALVDGLTGYQQALQGTPAETFAPDGDGMGPTGTQPAVPGNRQAALAALLRSEHPVLQQLGVAEMTKKAENPFGKVDPKDYTQESVLKFSQTQNFADLTPVRKMDTVNDQVVDLYSAKPGTVIPKQSNPYSDLLVSDGAGGVKQNTPLIDAKKVIAKSGAPSVNVKTDIKMNEGIANQVGPMMKESVIAATGAAQQVDAANRIIQAVDTNKIYAGPLASTRLKIAQVGDLMGISGKDEAEKIANTRQAIRGLSEMTLEGRKKMRGEGQITESEGKLAERANSGDIDDLTPAEIKMLANASKRSAIFLHQEHNRKVEQMRKTPGLENVTPFYEVPPLPGSQPTNSPVDNLLKKYGG